MTMPSYECHGVSDHWHCRKRTPFCVEPPDSKVHGANMGPTWGRQDPGGPHVGPMSLAIRATIPTNTDTQTQSGAIIRRFNMISVG